MDELVACFRGMEDPRAPNHVHPIEYIIVVTILALMSGFEDCVGFAEYARLKHGFLAGILDGFEPPSHDTFSRVHRTLGRKAFAKPFATFVETFVGSFGGLVAFDGKFSNGSADAEEGRGPLGMMTAFATESRMVIGQIAIDEKSNEIPAIQELIRALDLEGCLVVADKMHAQRETCRAILDGKADYLLPLGDNQPTFLAAVRTYVDGHADATSDTDTTVDGDHGRIDTRTAVVVKGIGRLKHFGWPGLACVGRIRRLRELSDGTKTSSWTYFASSRVQTAAQLNAAARGEWGIENGLHWQLDIHFGEDDARTRKGSGPESLAVMRHCAMNLLRRKPDKRSMRLRMLNAAVSDAYLLDLLSA